MNIWDRAEQTVAGALGLIALGLALWQVLSRYLLPGYSISFAEEVMTYLVIWAVMIVSSQLGRSDGHVRPDLVLNLAPPAATRWMEIFNSIAAIVFCVALIRYGWEVVQTACLIDERGASDLRFPMWVYYAALPAGGVLMLLRYAIRLADLLATSRWQAMLRRRPGAHELPGLGETAR